MKAVQLTAPGFEGAKVVEIDEPTPGPEDVLIRMKAVSFNARDVGVASGKMPNVKPGLVPLSDGVGVVEAVGANVTRLKVGDRVCPIFAPRWIAGPASDENANPALGGGSADGVLRQKMAISAQSVVKAPASLSDIEAATLPCAAVTAWSAVIGYAQVKPGDTVLVEGTGGVALFALQIAKLAGARVVVLSSSDEKAERAKALGADLTFNYVTTPEWGAEVQKATGGADLVVDTVGASTLPQALLAVARNGKIAQVGMLGGASFEFPLRSFIPRGTDFKAIYVGGRDKFEELVKAVDVTGLKPVVSETFGFGEMAKAYGAVAAGSFGKITMTVD